ncbi:MAG: sigma-E processing peptidase SpoIIGA [Clostridiales bacterium]|nr:sigma-E processing peptidase SpoIIGA [Clostridiales bacterium]
MKISIELFLLDNFIMNYLLFSLASVLSGTHMRMGYTALSAGIGAGYALAGLAWLPVLQWLPVKGLAFGLLALPLRAKGQKYIYLLLSVFLAAFLLSGTLLFLTGLFGGSVGRNGTLVGAVPLRVALLGAGLCATLPRLFRKLFAAHHLKAFTAQITIEWGGQSMTCTALLDSGNALTEPLSGLPVILVAGPLPAGPRRPIPYQTQGGTGLLQGARPDRVLLMDTHEVNAWVCAAPQPIQGADAIFPSCLVPNEWRGMRNEGLGMRNFSASLRGARMRRVSG